MQQSHRRQVWKGTAGGSGNRAALGMQGSHVAALRQGGMHVGEGTEESLSGWQRRCRWGQGKLGVAEGLVITPCGRVACMWAIIGYCAGASQGQDGCQAALDCGSQWTLKLPGWP